jgi:hypothetical protein
VTQSLRIATIARRTAIAAVIIVALTGLVWWSVGPSIGSAASRVEDLTAQNAAIQAKVNALGPVGNFYGQLERLEGLVSDTLASSPQAVVTLARLEAAAAAGGNVRFSKVTVVYHGIPKVSEDINRCPTPDPFSERVTIGCVDFSATAGSREEVARFIAELEKDPFFIGPYVSSTTSDAASTVTFTGSVGISLKGLVAPISDDSVIAALAAADDTTVPEATP